MISFESRKIVSQKQISRIKVRRAVHRTASQNRTFFMLHKRERQFWQMWAIIYYFILMNKEFQKFLKRLFLIQLKVQKELIGRRKVQELVQRTKSSKHSFLTTLNSLECARRILKYFYIEGSSTMSNSVTWESIDIHYCTNKNRFGLSELLRRKKFFS